jgi:hypothetical protein
MIDMRFIFAMISVVLAAGTASAEPALTKVASFKHQVTGVPVAPDGRVFVNFPRWSEDAPISVAEVKNGVPVAFPNAEWNAWRNSKSLSAADHWICVQSVLIGPHGNLWVVDPAAPAMGATIKGGPKLVEIDLKTNQPALAGHVLASGELVGPSRDPTSRSGRRLLHGCADRAAGRWQRARARRAARRRRPTAWGRIMRDADRHEDGGIGKAHDVDADPSKRAAREWRPLRRRHFRVTRADHPWTRDLE